MGPGTVPATAADAEGASTASDPLATTTDPLTPSPEPQVPAPTSSSTPSPTPSSAPPQAQVSLVRAACDSVRLAARTDPGAMLSYRITDEGGRTAASGQFTGSVDLMLSLSTGHTYLATVSQSADGAGLASSASADLTAPCPVAVTADAPLFSDPCGTDHDAVLAPRIIGVDYQVGGTALAPGANSAVGAVSVVASARPGYSLSGPTQWSHVFSSAPCPESQPVPAPAAAAPTAAAPAASSDAPVQATTPPPAAEGQQNAATGSSSERSTQTAASAWAPGPLAWGVMIALAVAGGVFFWSKTRH